jgi:hypothetical protein
MTDFGRSAKGPTLTDISSVASNATEIASLYSNMADIQDVAAEINATPSLRDLMDDVLNDTISLSGLTDTTIGTLSASNNGDVLAYNSTSGQWEVSAASGGASQMNQLSDVPANPTNNGYGLKYNTTSTNYEPANFAEIGVAYTPPGGQYQLAVSNIGGTFGFASTINGDYTFSNNITIGGNLNVTGTTTTINTTSLEVADKSITLSNSATPSETSANGSGIDVDVTNMGALWTTDAPRIEYSSANTGLDQYWNLNRGIVAKGWSDAGSNVYDGQITLNCSANTHGITIKSAPHADNATYDLILPANAPAAGQVLAQNSANNQLEFVDLPSSGASTGFAIAMAIVF